jgi:hypothetical protein
MFLPRTIETHSWIDLYALYESDDLTAGNRRFTWRDEFFKERLSLQTSGYVYHPRLLRYRLLVSGALKQENYEESTLAPLGWQSGHALEYDARVFLLPEHPYSLELFATRYEPLYREQYATPTSTVSTTAGADLRYRVKPWYFHARAGEDGFDSAGVSTTVRKLSLDAKYAQDFTDGRKVSFDASYAPSRLTDTTGFSSNMSDASLMNTLESQKVRLYSSVTQNDLDQAGGPTTLKATSRMLSWYEQMSADLPFRLRADAYWRYQDNNSEYGSASAADATALTNVHKSAELDLKHRLYDSLLTTYIFRWESDTSNGGDTTAVNNALNFDYTKRIEPVNGRLVLGLNLGAGETRNSGQVQLADEPHPAVQVPGTFSLQQPGGEAASVVVLVKSVQAPFELVQLAEGLNYTVAAVGNGLEITVLSLPADFLVPGKYDFRVSYSLLAGNFTARLRTFGQSGSLALFDSLLTPYYSYTALKSDVLSGTYPGGGIDSQVLTAGLSFFEGPLRARIEYGNVRWAVSPWHGWKGEIQYVGALGPTTNVNGIADWQVRSFDETLGTGGLPAYTERVATASGSVQQFLLTRTLSIAAGGSYSYITGLSESRAYTLNATLSWRIGKLDLSGGANYSNTRTQDATAYAGRTMHEYYFLRLRRMLF